MKIRERWKSHAKGSFLSCGDRATPDQCLTPLELALRFTNGNLGNVNHYDDFQNRYAVRPSYDLSDSDRMQRINDRLQSELEASLEEDRLKNESQKKPADDVTKTE